MEVRVHRVLVDTSWGSLEPGSEVTDVEHNTVIVLSIVKLEKYGGELYMYVTGVCPSALEPGY